MLGALRGLRIPQMGDAVLACAHAQHRCHHPARRLRVVLVLETAPNLALEK